VHAVHETIIAPLAPADGDADVAGDLPPDDARPEVAGVDLHQWVPSETMVVGRD